MHDKDRKTAEFLIGEDLYGVSVDELHDRITLLRSEIDRINAELSKKEKDLTAAQQLFGS